uniref:NADH-ubiquinone oxidoreductase chain 2 n=1 Tax=Norvellina sp. EMHAU-15062816 TaxID=2040462 RepID=A0A343KGL2_9HEMI|nr:NADH dehydrogenase subunit 2 [Norvellina sp. EMHAU-15062816]
MLFNSTKLILTNTMMIGVIMTICSNNWISMWMGLEMSTLSFIPLVSSMNTSESMMKYFVMQSVASTMFLFSVIYMLIGVNMLNEIYLAISMTIKLGSAPFHMWVIMIIDKIDYFNMFTLLTILKLPPLSIMFQINSDILLTPILMSLIISSIACLNQSSMRKIIAYSSVYNMGIMMTLTNMINLLTIYMFIYSSIMIMLIYTMKIMKINFINQMIHNEFSKWIKLNVWINMLSMSGFPPLMGFLTKMMVIQSLINSNQMILMVTLMLTSMLSTLFYMRLAFSSMMTLSSLKKWSMNKNKSMLFMMTTNLTLTPMLMAIF